MTPDADTPRPHVQTRPWLAQITLGVVAIGAAVGLAAWWMRTTPSTTRRPREREATPVRVSRVQVQSHPLHIVAHGSVVPSRQVQLRPQVRGRVLAVHADLVPGSVLPKGAVLAQIDPQDYELEVERLESELVAAQSALQLEQGNQAIARREYELLGDLAKDADASLALRKPQLAAAQAAVRGAESRLASARLQLARTRVTVPFDAVVRSKDVAVGAQVTETTVLAELVGIDRWWVEVTLPASDLRWIRRAEQGDGGLPAARVLDEAAWGPGVDRTGRVARIAADLQREGRLARLFVEIPDPLARSDEHSGAPRLLIDAWVRVELAVGRLDGVVALDPAWIRDGRDVWICAEDDTLQIRPVTTAFRDAERVLVSAGLADGDRVITSDLAAAVLGMRLRVIAPATPASDRSARGSE